MKLLLVCWKFDVSDINKSCKYRKSNERMHSNYMNHTKIKERKEKNYYKKHENSVASYSTEILQFYP